MSKEEYILESFPSDEEMERAARKCTMLAYCPDRPFSFCLKKWVEVDGELVCSMCGRKKGNEEGY